MNESQNISNVTIEYKNDIDSTNRIIDFIIDFLLESNLPLGEDIDTRACRKGLKNE
ncbi:hypothetical protein [Clostridium magnum]|uniref:Uncharacterized protein n=1 Tax=Clostridium magnum DSM 2767 TaxID=1121326 RepID=A0A161Y5Q8_9CLOT|nr:hypothetical protein [Clostridium magnum]KZL93599.1 hypothetical protein CLMAG_06450 [Clostridium magnum DSM 2767]SHI58466.1 hypothetical protein SAMN02745944_04531 [Clostridium magnum DSM 2767]